MSGVFELLKMDDFAINIYGALLMNSRAQRRVCRLKCVPEEPCCDPCIAGVQNQYMVNHEPYRQDVNHRNDLDAGIPSPHISNTNRGFARSVDGLFYNS